MTAILHAPARPAAHRGAGRRTTTRWYHIVVVGPESSTAADGTVTTQQVIEGFNLEVPNTYLGLGTRDRIEAAAAARGKEVIEFWPIARPLAA